MALFTYTTVSNCKFEAEWVLNIRGLAEVIVRGGSFPGLPGGVVYNVIGQRDISITETKLNGHLLAPLGTLDQPNGVIVGKVVAADILSSRQINKPDCPNPGIVELPGTNNEPVEPGNYDVPMLNTFNFRAGDTITYNKETNVIAGVYHDNDNTYITVQNPTQSNLPQGSIIVAHVDGNAGRAETNIESSSSSILSISFALIALFAFLF
jgi:hypothetical protein